MQMAEHFNDEFLCLFAINTFLFLQKSTHKGWRLKKWTGLRGRNSRSRSARVKRLSSADTSQHLQ